jgi:hypothetical protein
MKCVSIYVTALVRKFSISKKISLRYYHKCRRVFMQGACYYFQNLIKLEFPLRIFEKKIHM